MSKTTRLVVVRHGETVWNREKRLMGHSDSALSDEGRRQVGLLAKRLSKWQIDALYSSDLGRAVQTAQAISDRISLPPVLLEGLRERSLGVFQGLTREEIEARYPNELAAFHTDPHAELSGGESRNQFHARSVASFTRLVEGHAGETLVVVTHGGVLDCLARHVLQQPISAPRSVRLLNASLNLVEVTDGSWVLRTWGDVAHLEGSEIAAEGWR